MGFNYDSEEYKQPLQYVLNQFLYGENVALRLAGKWVAKAPEAWQREYLALDQTPEEARHVKVFSRRIREIGGEPLAVCNGDKSLVNAGLVDLCDVLLASEEWVDAIATMQISLEGLAMATFNTFLDAKEFDPKTQDLLPLVMEEEYRHTLFGDRALKQFVENNPERRGEIIPKVMAVFQSMMLAGRERWRAGTYEEIIEEQTKLPRSFEQVGCSFEDMIARYVADLTCRLERAGFTFAEIQKTGFQDSLVGPANDPEFVEEMDKDPELKDKMLAVQEAMQASMSPDKLMAKIPKFYQECKKEFDPTLPPTREAAGAGPCH